MTKARKIISLLLVLAMAFSLTACGDTSWIVKVDDQTVNSGMYIYYQREGYSAAGYELMATDSSYYFYMAYGLSYFEDKVGDKTVEEYMNDYAMDMCKQYVVINKLFDELGLELTDDDKALIDTQVRSAWNSGSESLIAAGVGEETLRKIVTIKTKEDKVFNHYYEVGGANGTTENDIKNYLGDNYARIKYMTFNFADSADDAVDEERKNNALELANAYLERANSGEDMDELIEEYESGDLAEEDEEEHIHVHSEYENEYVIHNKGTAPSEKFVNYVFNDVKTGEIKLIQDDTNIYLVQKLDILERDDIYEENRDYFLQELFDDDFTKLVNEKLKGYTVEENAKSQKRYTAKNALGMED